MKCTTAKKWISSDIDGGLKTARKRALEVHLETCLECQKLRDDFKKIVRTANTLEEFSPAGEDTWFKIVAGLKDQQAGTVRPIPQREKTRLWSPGILAWLASAVLLLVIVMGSLLFWPKIGEQNKSSQKYILSKLEEAEDHYEKAIEALWQAVSSQRDEIDPQLYAVFQKNLAIIDQSIIACKEAVLSRPDSLNSRDFLLAAYKEKRNLLEEMIGANMSPLE